MGSELEAKAAYYAREVGITRDEAARIIPGTRRPKLSIAERKNAVRPSRFSFGHDWPRGINAVESVFEGWDDPKIPQGRRSGRTISSHRLRDADRRS